MLEESVEGRYISREVLNKWFVNEISSKIQSSLNLYHLSKNEVINGFLESLQVIAFTKSKAAIHYSFSKPGRNSVKHIKKFYKEKTKK